MINKEPKKYTENFETFVVNKLIDHGDGILSLNARVLKLTLDMEDVKEKVAVVPRMYQMLDKLVGDLALDRQERMLMYNKLSDHDERLTVVENMLAIKPPTEVF